MKTLFTISEAQLGLFFFFLFSILHKDQTFNNSFFKILTKARLNSSELENETFVANFMINSTQQSNLKVGN